MKNGFSKLNMKKFTIVLACILVVLAMLFTLFACSKDETNPSNFPAPDNIDGGDVPPDDNPSGDNPSGDVTPDDNPTPDQPAPDAQLEELKEFFASLDLSSKNATTTITVSFGGRTLAQKTTTYTRTQNGGTMQITLVSLDEASAKEPYKTERLDAQTLGEADFESRFPRVDQIDAEIVKALEYRLSASQNGATLSFDIAPAMLKSLLSLTDEEAINIATNVSVSISSQDLTLTANYKSANGNNVQIKIIYQ